MGSNFETILGAMCAMLSFTLWLPSARIVWKQRNNPAALAAVSLGTQTIVIVSALMWATYAVVAGAFWSGVPAVVNIPIAIMTVTLVLRSRKMTDIQTATETVQERNGDVQHEPVADTIPIPVQMGMLATTGSIPIIESNR